MTPLDTEALPAPGRRANLAGRGAPPGRTRVEGRAPPSTKDELWKYVDLDFDLADYRLVDEPASARAGRDLRPRVRRSSCGRDRRRRAGRSRVPEGVTVGSLAAAVAAGHPRLDEVLAAALAADTDVFAAAHTAFGGDGALVHVEAGAAADPVLVRLHTATEATVNYPTVVVIAEENAGASVVVDIGSADVDAVTVPPSRSPPVRRRW